MKPSSDERVALTGCGWVTPFAAGTIDEVLEAAPGEDPSPGSLYRPVPDALLDAYPDFPAEIKADRGAWLAAVAWHHARAQANIQPDTIAPERVGLVLGQGLAGEPGMITFANEVRDQSARFVSPIHFPQTVGNYIAGALARAYSVRGPNLTLASGPASAVDALVAGCDLIVAGQADVVFAGGVEVLSDELAQVLPKTDNVACEGACFVVLESASQADRCGAAVLATVIGEASEAACDASSAVLSCAAGRRPGAICIAHWIGQCPGPAGTAAVAAAIGAVRGHAVPVADGDDPTQVAVRRLALDKLAARDGSIPAFILAEAPERRELGLSLPVPAD